MLRIPSMDGHEQFMVLGPGLKFCHDADGNRMALASDPHRSRHQPGREPDSPAGPYKKKCILAGHEVGAANWALLASIVATCKMSDVNPIAYIAETLRAILDGHPRSRIADLMPWHFFAATSFSTALSSIASASSFLSLAFSSSRAFSRRAWDTSSPSSLVFQL
jgi:hypothetical protein